MTDTVLEIAGVGKRYVAYRSNLHRFANWFGARIAPQSEFWAVQDVSFRLERGESVALIGGNGAGKSTLLKMITGTVRPSAGTIGVNGRISAILELGLGFNPEFSGRQNVLNAGGLMGLSQAELQELMPSIQAFAEIGEFFDAPLRIYSSGMQARLAFALATAQRPDILIVDEALSVGDSYFQAKCFERIAAFRREGTSLILVTHAMTEVVKHCERAILLSHGHIEFDGDSRVATNFYLSALSGAGGGTIEQPVAPGTEIQRNEDVFNTRPGYRSEEHRWGEGGATILDYVISQNGSTYPSEIVADRPVQLTFSIRFLTDVDVPVLGILVKSVEGLFIYGTNSVLTDKTKSLSPPARRGDVRVITFVVPMRLATGAYLLSFGVSDGELDSLKPLDRRYDSVLVHVRNDSGFWGLCDLGGSFKTENDRVEVQ